jgi:hypothetical protein
MLAEIIRCHAGLPSTQKMEDIRESDKGKIIVPKQVYHSASIADRD